MKDRISILVDCLPRYGEILIGVGSIAISYEEALLDNMAARNELKQYLISEAPKKGTILRLSKSQEFQKMIYEHTGEFVNMIVRKDSRTKDKIVNILMADFFGRVIWPILVNKYMDTICEGINNIVVSINVKKNVYLKIYDEDNPDLFFDEFKDFLQCNYIVICEANKKENGDILFKLMLPIAPNTKFKF